MMRWIGRMDAQRALVEGGKDDAGTGELVFILIKILIVILMFSVTRRSRSDESHSLTD